MPADKRRNIIELVTKFTKLQPCSIRELARFIGILVATSPALKYAWVYTKILERQKFLALLKHNNNYEAKINLPNIILEDLNWWLSNVNTARNFMRQPNFDIEIYTDASMSGWGSVCNNAQVHGKWKSSENYCHINYLELMAAFLGLKSFASDATNK